MCLCEGTRSFFGGEGALRVFFFLWHCHWLPYSSSLSFCPSFGLSREGDFHWAGVTLTYVLPLRPLLRERDPPRPATRCMLHMCVDSVCSCRPVTALFLSFSPSCCVPALPRAAARGPCVGPGAAPPLHPHGRTAPAVGPRRVPLRTGGVEAHQQGGPGVGSGGGLGRAGEDQPSWGMTHAVFGAVKTVIANDRRR